ncbi:MAG: glycosyltransferase family 2 protein [Candidatus Daviesbacteria bacterium]|nr:MAG: glycosyltransferase family 2 protein [Candidatus Daviesbacteria bacterium]
MKPTETRKQKIVAIFIAYNCARTLRKFYENFPRHLVDDIILVDDASFDHSYELAKSLGIHAYKNPINLGYGGNLKRILALGIKRGGDVFIDIHPDGEYKTNAIPLALEKIKNGSKFILGNRFTYINQPLKSGMYFWKFIPIFLMNTVDSLILGTKIGDLHQGFRVYTKELLEKVSFENNSNNYLFSFELIAQASFWNIKIDEVPVETNYTGKKRGATLKNSIRYSLGTFKILFLYLLTRAGIKNKIFLKPKKNILERVEKLSK